MYVRRFFLGAISCFPFQSFLKGQYSSRISPYKKGFSLQSGLRIYCNFSDVFLSFRVAKIECYKVLKFVPICVICN